MKDVSRPTVKILVSCHKEVPLPASDVYLPVQVGSFGKRQIKGMQPDCEGENISDRNFSFCELTAQYWAWKNLDADYYGMCHYRRYFCFDGIGRPANDHAQIEADSLSDYSFRDFHINDAELVYDRLASCDVVVPLYWNVSNAYTPDGIKMSVQEHMVAFGLYTDEDVELLRAIIEEKQPEYLESFDRYMSGGKYLGYNCFIMRRDIFQRFCEFEFDVLLEFDRRFDYSDITTTRKRICGYFGEVLYSVFVEKLVQDSAVRIAQAPLVFFLDTARPVLPVDQDGAELDSVKIVWRYRDRSPNALKVCVESLLDQVDPDKRYELTLLYDIEFILDAFNNILPKMPDNVTLKMSHWSTCSFPGNASSVSLEDLDVAQPLLLPWLCKTEGSVLWVDGLALFQRDPAVLVKGNCAKPYYGIKNVLLHRELNKPEARRVLGAYGLSPTHDLPLDSTTMVINLNAARETYSPEQVCDIVSEFRARYRLIEPDREIGKQRTQRRKTPVAAGYLLENQAFRAHLLNRLSVDPLSMEDVSHAVDSADTALWLNEDWALEWKAAENPALVYLEYGKPPLLSSNQRFGSAYWRQARKSDIYEVLLAEVLEPEGSSLKETLFPEGSKRNRIARSLLRKLRK